jgi:hypothetical protein
MADDDDITPAPAYDEAAPAAPPAAGAVTERKKSGKAIAALVCGIIGILILGVILGPIAVILGSIARKEIAANPSLDGAGMALAGIITGAIGFVLAVVLIALGVGVGV